MIPFYLKNNLTNVKEKGDITTATLASSTGNMNLEIFFYGELIDIKKTPYITDSEFPCLIVAKDTDSGEEFVVFDGMKHGYEAMFCNEVRNNPQRNLVKYEKYNGKIKIQFGYSIDYEDEKDEYEFTNENTVKLMYGEMNWEDAKSIGFDWISMKFCDLNKEFFEMELA